MYASPWIADTFVLIDDDRILDAILRCVPIVLEVLSAFPESDAFIFSSHSSCMCSQDSQTKHCIVGHCACWLVTIDGMPASHPRMSVLEGTAVMTFT